MATGVVSGCRRVSGRRRVSGHWHRRTAELCCRGLGMECESFDVLPWKVLVLLTEAPLFCRDLDADALLDFFLIVCDPSPLIP